MAAFLRGRGLVVLVVSIAVAGAGGACGGGGDSSQFDASTLDASLAHDAGPSADGTTGPHDSGPGFGIDSGGGGGSDAGQLFDVQPNTLQTIVVLAGHTTPSVVFSATYGGQPVNAGWSVDRGDLASIAAGPSQQGTLSPSGTTGGLVTVVAGRNGQTLKRQVFIKLTSQQNGATSGESGQVPTTVPQLAQGGGVGGVGGEGLGPAVTDMPTLNGLQHPTGNGSTEQLTFLYPYDKTVFPRGLLAPLLQWSWSTGDADGVLVTLATTSGSFSWSGAFARPAILTQTSGKFIRMPIPDDVWQMATNSAGGPTPNATPDQLTVGLTVASGGNGYGPITETWTVAAGRLAGTVYYNSYGTQLVKNSTDNDFNGNQYGAAVLGIAEGATGPAVVAGTASPLTGTGCRVCHTVSMDGSRLNAQQGDNYARTSTYDLKSSNAETSLSTDDNIFGWAALSPDGKLAFTNSADLAASAPASQLYAFPPPAPPAAATPLDAGGIPSNLQAGAPAFSPDSKHVAFEFLSGSIGTTTGNGTQLVSLDFDPTTNTFSNLKVLVTMANGQRAGFPSFFPTDDAVAFHYQLVNAGHRYNTWNPAEAQIWWSDLATGTAASLYALNGFNPDGMTSYLPVGSGNHANDTVFNYEPTVNPVVSGGYAWIIFTSRRQYGNVATTDPWLSDPRRYDTTKLANTTCKKLWVAAIDLTATAGKDRSHPAFYLPAQELLAGNARGFWVLDPCKADGQSCQSGDQCCNGYCEPGGDGGLECTNTPPNAQCSMPQEKCKTTADCCDSTNTCVNGFCAVSIPK